MEVSCIKMEKYTLLLGLLLLQACDFGSAFPNYEGNLNADYLGTVINVDLTVFVKSGETPPTGAVNNVTIVGSSSPYAQDGDCTEPSGGSQTTIAFTIDTLTDTISSGTGCFLETITTGSYYDVFVRVFTTVDEEDVVFQIRLRGTDLANSDFGASRIQAVVPLLMINIGDNIYSFVLDVVDPDNGHAVTTALDLGAKFVLQLTMTITNYQADIDYGGCRVHTCKVADNSGFTNAVTFVGTDACWDTTKIFPTTAANTGFSRTDALSAISSGTKTYVARSPEIETSAITDETDFYGTRSLYFKCTLDLCYDDSGSTGTCGDNHCAASGRKKRSVLSNDTVVLTTLDIIGAPRKEPRKACSSTMMFQGTIVALSAIVLVMFTLTLINVISLRKTNARLASKRRANADFYVAGGSQASLKSTTLIGKSGSHISSATSYPRERKC